MQNVSIPKGILQRERIRNIKSRARLTSFSFDTASLAILEKLNTIEELLRKPTPVQTHAQSPVRQDSSSNVVQTPASIPSVLSAAAPEKPMQSPKRRMSIETVLSWHSFSDQSPNLDLKGLLVAHDLGIPGSAINTDFVPHIDNDQQLLQRFLDTVFIYNPVLEESTLHQYIREIQFDGLKWDARSCLVVSNLEYHSILILTIAASDICTWMS